MSSNSISKSPIDVWVLDEKDILRKVFNVSNLQPSKTEDELLTLLAKAKEAKDESAVEHLNEALDRLHFSRIYENETKKLWQSYIEAIKHKSSILDSLIAKVKAKLESLS